MKKSLFIVLISFILNISAAQNIEIGADAEYAKTLIEWSVSKQNRSNPLKNINKPYWTAESKYENGILQKIILCKLNQPIPGLTISTDFCEYCTIKDGKVNSLTKEFKSLNLETVKNFYLQNYTLFEIDGLYFTDSFDYYYKFIFSKEHTSIVEYHKTKNSPVEKTTLSKIEIKKKKKTQMTTEKAIEILMSNDGKSDGDINYEIQKLKTETKKNDTEINAEVMKDSIQSKSFKRKVISGPKPRYICNEQGIVVVQVSIDKDGRVKEVKSGIEGTTNFAECLIKQSEIAARNTKFEADSNAPEIQIGTIRYNFGF